MLATYCQTVLLMFRWEGMAAFTNCSSYDATSRTYLSQHWEQREQRSKVTEERHSSLPGCRILCNHMVYAHAPDMTLARQRSLPVMARARSITRWLFRLFSRYISGMQSFKENGRIKINALIHKSLVPLIGRLVARSAITRAADRPSTVTLAAHAHRGLNISKCSGWSFSGKYM